MLEMLQIQMRKKVRLSTRVVDGLLGGDGVLYRGGVIKLPAAGAKILAMLTINHYIYALKLVPLTRY